jgi:hypothetical protein
VFAREIDDRLIVTSELPLVMSLFCYGVATDQVKRSDSADRRGNNEENSN